jgi:non-lysosomal glucosylceramidase
MAHPTAGEQVPGPEGDGGPTRRDAIKAVGVALAAAVVPASRRAVADAVGPTTAPTDLAHLIPIDKRLDPEWVASLTARGKPTVHRGDQLAYIGMPVGGLCAGQVYLGGDGTLWHWDIFNQLHVTKDAHYAHPLRPVPTSVEQGFALHLNGRDPVPLNRAGFPDVTFCGQYPIGTVTYARADVPVTVTLEAFSPFVPLSTDDSSLPATVMRFTIRNASASAVEGSLAGWLRRTSPAGTTRVVTGRGMTWVETSTVAPASQPARPDIRFEDWHDYAGWTVEGTAFGTRPCRRADVPAYMGDVGADRFVNSHVSAPGGSIGAKDGQTGELSSRPFTIERTHITFLIGGGHHPGQTGVNLLVDGHVVRTCSGSDSNRMETQSWDVTNLAGRTATLEIVDAATGAWGNVGVGPISFVDGPADQHDAGSMGLALLGPPSDESDAATGTIGRTFSVAPRGSVTVDFVVAWHYPNLRLARLGNVGRHYATRFASALAVAQHVSDDFDRLTSQTRLWRDTWYDSTLPHWLLDRTFMNVSLLATGTCYRFADGRFYAWEGVGYCPGTCTHVWSYAQAAARLFPELERDTRERAELGVGFNPATGVIGFRGEFDRHLAVDGQAGTILRCYREHQMCADDAFLRRVWPRVRKAFDPLLALDPAGAGVMVGPQANTLDATWYGRVAWLTSMYLAALRAGAAMASDVGDAPFADRCRTIADRGLTAIVEQMFDRDYFVNRVDPAHLDAINSGTGCEIDQVLGQGWAFQVGLPRAVPERESRSALAALWKYNFAPDVGPYRQAHKPGRWYAMPGESGLLMCTFPRDDWNYNRAKGKGADWAAGYFDECMTGFEHQAAGHMVWEGMVQQGLAIERAVHDRHAAERRNPWNEVEAGDHYARSMASYGVFTAACGYEYHGPRGHLAFAPRLTPDDFRAPFTAAEGWGTFAQQRQGDGLHASLDLKWGQLRLRTLALATGGTGVQVELAGAPVAATVAVYAGRATVLFDPPVTIATGERLTVHVVA